MHQTMHLNTLVIIWLITSAIEDWAEVIFLPHFVCQQDNFKKFCTELDQTLVVGLLIGQVTGDWILMDFLVWRRSALY